MQATTHHSLIPCQKTKSHGFWIDPVHDLAHCAGTQMLTLTEGQGWVQWAKEWGNGQQISAGACAHVRPKRY